MAIGGVCLLLTVLITIIGMILTRKGDDGYNVYTHKSGKQKSNKNDNPIAIKFAIAPKTLRFSAIFSDGCDYDSFKIGNAINRLYGISYGFDSLWRSVNIGWRYNSNLKVIELFAVAFVKGKRYVKELINVSQYQEIDFTISYDEKQNNVIILAVEDGCNKKEQEIRGIDKSWIGFIQHPSLALSVITPNIIKLFIK